MKRKLMLLATFLLLFSTISFAQDVPDGLINAFKKGSTAELSKFFGDQVELVIVGQTTNGNKAKAESTMNGFFTSNKPGGFTVNHKGKKGESSFVIGTLNTSSGNYRVNCFFKKNQNQYLIHQIRIDKTNE